MAKKRLVVIVHRDLGGQVLSEVADINEQPNWPEMANYARNSVVIDRPTRILDVSVLRRRAAILASVIGAELHEDLSWPCAIDKKQQCRCPECIKAGRA